MDDIKRLTDIIARFSEKRILVVGDFFLDRYLIIDPQRDETSLETGLTAYQVVSKRVSPGAAGTVMNNLAALEIGHLTALGIVGEDGEGYELLREMKKRGIDTQHMIMRTDRMTPTYTKPMRAELSGERELSRLDQKNFTVTPIDAQDALIEKLFALAPEHDAIIALDQVAEPDCGVITTRVREAIAELGRSGVCPIIYADSRAYITAFRDVLIKCNQHEAMMAVFPGAEETPEVLRDAAKEMCALTRRPVFITQGEKGQWVSMAGEIIEVLAFAVEGEIDICGAGDATTAGTVAALACGATPAEAARIGNAVSSITIKCIGSTGTATRRQVIERISGIA